VQTLTRCVPINRCYIHQGAILVHDGMRHEPASPRFVGRSKYPASYSSAFRVLLNPVVHVFVAFVQIGAPALDANVVELDLDGQIDTLEKPLEVFVTIQAHT